jgi:predicted RNase H-like HicB family nuclease
MFSLLRRKPILELRVSIVVEPDDGRFHAYAPALKGLHVDGETQEEAFRNAREAVVVYLNSLARHHDSLPVGPDLSVREIQPEIPQGAFLHSVTIQWPSLRTSGIS